MGRPRMAQDGPQEANKMQGLARDGSKMDPTKPNKTAWAGQDWPRWTVSSQVSFRLVWRPCRLRFLAVWFWCSCRLRFPAAWFSIRVVSGFLPFGLLHCFATAVQHDRPPNFRPRRISWSRRPAWRKSPTSWRWLRPRPVQS